MAEASPKFYRTQIVLTLIGAVFMLGLCARLLREGSTPASVGFGVVFCLLIFLTTFMVVMRQMRQKIKSRSNKNAE